MYITVFIIIFGVLIIHNAFKKNNTVKLSKLSSQFPGPLSVLYFGTSLPFLLHPRAILRNIGFYAKKYGDRYRLWLGDQLVLVLSNAEDVEEVLKNVKLLDKGPRFSECFGRIFGNGTFSIRYPDWKENRKILQFPLKTKVMDFYIEEMNRISKILVERFRIASKMEETFVPSNHITYAVFNILYKTLFDFDRDISDQEINIFKQAAGKYLDDCHQNMFSPGVIKRFRKIILRKQLNELKKKMEFPFNEVMLQRQALTNSGSSQEKNEQNKSFIDYLFSSFTEDEIRDNIITYSAGGTETLSSTLNFTLLMLAIHPIIQEKVYQELYNILGDDEKDINAEDLKQVPYLEQVLQETLRLYPVVPLLTRYATEDTKIGNLFLPNGTEIFLNIYGIQRDARYFPNPEVFNPDNFSIEKSKELSKGCYLPFASGPRNCIGKAYSLQEMKIICCHILRKFEIKTNVKMEDIKLKSSFVLVSETGYKISILERKQS